MQQFEKKSDQQPAIAVQINLELATCPAVIYYHKWGSRQEAKQGDWLVTRDGEAYTIDAESFAKTYKQVGPGQYIKVAKIWAEQTITDGSIPTKEGRTYYQAGYWLVYNEADRQDGYAVSHDKFTAMYQPVGG